MRLCSTFHHKQKFVCLLFLQQYDVHPCENMYIIYVYGMLCWRYVFSYMRHILNPLLYCFVLVWICSSISLLFALCLYICKFSQIFMKVPLHRICFMRSLYFLCGHSGIPGNMCKHAVREWKYLEVGHHTYK